MRDETRNRLEMITARYARRRGRTAPGVAAEREAAARRFERIRAELFVPAMEEMGAELVRAGHGYRIAIDAAERTPSVELYLTIARGRPGFTNVIRLFASEDDETGLHEIIAEVELIGHPMEITRYRDPTRITPEVVDQMLIDTIEQIFAGNGG